MKLNNPITWWLIISIVSIIVAGILIKSGLIDCEAVGECWGWQHSPYN